MKMRTIDVMDYNSLESSVGRDVAINTLYGDLRDPAVDRLKLLVGILIKYDGRMVVGHPRFAIINPKIYEQGIETGTAQGTFLLFPNAFNSQEPRVVVKLEQMTEDAA